LVTGVIDETGNRLASYAYDSQGRAISSQHVGGVDLYSVSYPASEGAATTVTDPLGTQRTYNYGTAVGKLAVTGADKPSGTGASDAASRVQDANGFVTQETDFLGVNTMYTWDINRRLPLTTTKAAGLPEAQTVTTQWHATYRLPVLVTEAGRSTAYSYDALGNMLTRTVTDTASSVSRTTTWTYNATGQVLTAKGSRTDVDDTTRFAYYSTSTDFTDHSVSSDPSFDSVSLLLHADGANNSVAVTDNSRAAKALTVAGGAKISTAQSKFGGSSIYFDGAGDYLSTPYSPDFDFGSGAFTVEAWVYIAAPSAAAAGTRGAIIAAAFPNSGSPGAGTWAFGLSGDATTTGTGLLFQTDVSGAEVPAHVASVPQQTWTHVAVSATGSNMYFAIGGVVSAAKPYTKAVNALSYPVKIGALEFNIYPRELNGYLDDVRITKGVARYTANFTPPAQAFPNVGAAALDPNATGHTKGDLQSITNAAGHVTQFTLYDVAGRVRQMVDAKGVVTDTTYTPRGWVASTTVTPPGGTARTTSYTYDAVGQLTQAVMPDGSTLGYSYDAAHRLTGVTDAKGNAVSYTLDSMGNRVGEQLKDPQGNLQRSISRVYDALNRVQQITGAGN
jgi:YD repeat-containing protein